MTSLVDPSPRVLGSLGAIGPLALGQWRFTNRDVAAATALVEAAIDQGINLVDTADVYGLDWGGGGFGACEELLGDVLAATPGLRTHVVLATKGASTRPRRTTPARRTSRRRARRHSNGCGPTSSISTRSTDMIS